MNGFETDTDAPQKPAPRKRIRRLPDTKPCGRILSCKRWYWVGMVTQVLSCFGALMACMENLVGGSDFGHQSLAGLVGLITASAALCSIFSLRTLRAVAPKAFSMSRVCFITLTVSSVLFQPLLLTPALG